MLMCVGVPVSSSPWLCPRHLRCPLENCLCMPLYVGLGLLLGPIAFGVLGALSGGADNLCRC